MQENDPTAMHPQDTAIASYLYALNITDNILAYELAIQLVYVANLYWSRKLAAEIIKSIQTNGTM